MRLLIISEAAARLRCSPSTVRGLVHTGAIRASRASAGARAPIVIDEVEIELFLEARVIVPAADNRRGSTQFDECARLGIEPNHEFVS